MTPHASAEQPHWAPASGFKSPIRVPRQLSRVKTPEAAALSLAAEREAEAEEAAAEAEQVGAGTC